jgi:hypothetical protein
MPTVELVLMATHTRTILGASIVALMGTFAAWPQKTKPMELRLSGPVDHVDL